MTVLNRRLLWLTSIRMLVVVSIVLSYLLYNPAQVVTDDGRLDPNLSLFIAYTSIQSLIYLALLRLLRRSPEVQAYIQLAGDLVLITLLIYRLGEATQFSTLYIIVIAVAALFLKRTGVLVIAGLAYLLFASIVLHWLRFLVAPAAGLPPLPEEPAAVFGLFYNLVIHLVGFYGVAILTSYLARDAERSQQRLRETHLDLSYLQSLHGDIIESMSSGLVTTDLEGVVVSLNRSGEEILGRSGGELVGRHISESGMFTAGEWAALTGGSEHRVRAEAECRRRDAEPVQLGYTLTQLRDGEGNWHGYTLLFQDLTEWRKLEEQVRMQDRMAAIGQMAAGLAHEVGNPLAAISGSVEMLAGSFAGDRAQVQLLEIMLKESRRLDRTVKSFLQFARPRDHHPVEIDVAALMIEGVELLRNSDDVRPEHRIEADLDPLSAWIWADRDQIGQLFWNLARNALQAMPEGGRLTVVGRLADDVYRLEFRDTGHGMSDEERARLFQPFKSFFDGGTGLGMAIVYRIVSEHRGDIRVESQSGRGTVILVELPVRAPDRPPEQEEVGRATAFADR